MIISPSSLDTNLSQLLDEVNTGNTTSRVSARLDMG